MTFITYKNKDGEEIIYQQRKTTNGTSNLIWFDDEYFYSIRSTIEKEELIKMGESIK